jgi:hypothetical protein
MKSIKFCLTLLFLGTSLSLSSCSEPTSEQKSKEQLAKYHALTDTERDLAKANGKSYFEISWPSNDSSKTEVKGKFISCRPTDSNSNNLVSCNGFAGNLKGELYEKTMYCGYSASVVGCSDQDTVKP